MHTKHCRAPTPCMIFRLTLSRHQSETPFYSIPSKKTNKCLLYYLPILIPDFIEFLYIKPIQYSLPTIEVICGLEVSKIKLHLYSNVRSSNLIE